MPENFSPDAANTCQPMCKVIAIDGPSASGKGTLARRLADFFGYAYLDTGLLYRMVGFLVAEAGVAVADAEAVAKIARGLNAAKIGLLAGHEGLRNEAAAERASVVATYAGVRSALLKFQQNFAAEPPEGFAGAVLDGRDIGTVIVPDAKVKIYVTATAEARAERRYKELRQRDENVTYAQVLAELQQRDVRDANRSVVPAKPADDAVQLETSMLTADEAFAAALAIVREKMPAWFETRGKST